VGAQESETEEPPAAKAADVRSRNNDRGDRGDSSVVEEVVAPSRGIEAEAEAEVEVEAEEETCFVVPACTGSRPACVPTTACTAAISPSPALSRGEADTAPCSRSMRFEHSTNRSGQTCACMSSASATSEASRGPWW
jgi:hypothetical protein